MPLKGLLLHKSDSPEKFSSWITAATTLGIELEPAHVKEFDILIGRNPQIMRHHEPMTTLPNFVLPRLFSIGTDPSLQTLLRAFEETKITCFNRADPLTIAADKLRTLQRLQGADLPVIPTLLASFPLPPPYAAEYIGWPMVMKTTHGSQGSGVFLARNAGDYNNFMRALRTTGANQPILIQRFLAKAKGQDLRVFVINGKIAACAMRHAAKGDFRANFSISGQMETFPTTPEIEHLALATTQALGLFFAGIDLLHNGKNWVVCEANGSPGYKGIHQATQLNIPQLVLAEIQSCFHEHPNRAV